jgi:hypothetical protein
LRSVKDEEMQAAQGRYQIVRYDAKKAFASGTATTSSTVSNTTSVTVSGFEIYIS